jgi:hypothetical protein
MPKKVNRKKLTNQKLMIAIAMIALVTAIGSMSIGNMNRNAIARSSSSSDDQQDSGSSNDQQGSGSSSDSQQGSGSSDSGSSREDQLHQQLKDNGLCPPGHECSCTPASGVFHDHTNGFNINTGCTDNKG